MFMCEECNYIWEEKQRYIGDPETTHCPNCGSAEIEETKLQNFPQADAYSLLADVRADIQELLKSIDEYHETFSTAELESFSRQKLDAGIKMMRLKNKISEHFS